MKKYQVVLASGCHREVDSPVISEHRTLRAAVAAARKSDRYQVETSRSSRVLYRPPCRNDPRLGAGRYGNGPRPGEPSLDQCVREAEEAEAL